MSKNSVFDNKRSNLQWEWLKLPYVTCLTMKVKIDEHQMLHHIANYLEKFSRKLKILIYLKISKIEIESWKLSFQLMNKKDYISYLFIRCKFNLSHKSLLSRFKWLWPNPIVTFYTSRIKWHCLNPFVTFQTSSTEREENR